MSSRFFSSSRRFHTSTVRTASRYNWNPRTSAAFGLSEEDTSKLKLLSASQLASYRSPPKGVKALVRDFIHDALYNPHYGYFSRRAVIFSPPEPLPFRGIRNTAEFDNAVARIYAEISSSQELMSRPSMDTQLWHTPVELFQPWYGQAIARCLASEYLLKHFPYEDLIIYEMGGGNGTLALNVLDYLREEYPEIYERTTYNIIEISPALAHKQRIRLGSHPNTVKVLNQSVFDWADTVTSPCFFIALEVIDNFAHDVVTYDNATDQPYQGLTITSPTGDYEEVYEPLNDALIQRYLSYRDVAGHPAAARSNLLTSLPWARNMLKNLPFAPNMSRPEFIPTRLIEFLEILRDKFPRHRLLLSDFSSLPDTIEGAHTAPVVQTRYRGSMIPCSTYLVQPGFFDIFFPTNFDLLRDLYHVMVQGNIPTQTTESTLPSSFFFSRAVRQSPLGLSSFHSTHDSARVYTHKDFMLKYADLTQTTLRSGENPLLEYYSNVKMIF
ncbi:DUF185-domain-containing protein [Clavulina sp. PMI_390]|nr:DUF185-domain-containing protein [Clavulina sp. PMI_390]